MKLQHASWPEVEEYLKRSSAILIPIGSTEQHGPTGLIGTDALCPEVLANGIAERGGALVAPTLSIGMAQHHLGFPGSITLRPSTLIAVIQDVVNSLARHGFDRFFFLNGHGGNIASVTAAFSEIYAESSLGSAPSNRPALRCKLHNWWDVPGVKQLSKELFGADEGGHATCSEVSLTYYAFPEVGQRLAAASDRLVGERAPNGPIRDAADYRRRFPDGRIGSNPRRASSEAGARLYEAAVTELTEVWRRFAEEE